MRSEEIRKELERRRQETLLGGGQDRIDKQHKDGKLTVPPEQRNLEMDFPKIYRKLMESLSPQEGDVIVVGSADTMGKAEYGALAAALSHLDHFTDR